MSETQKTIEPIRIEAEGLTLVQMITEADDRAYFDLQNANLDFWKEFDNKIDESVEEVTQTRLESGNGAFGIWIQGKLVGGVGYSTKNHPEEAEVWVALDQGGTGHGYATKAVKTLTDFAKSQFDRVYAEIRADHVNSIELMKRAGYQTSGETVERDWGTALVFESPEQ
jgi:RimJ/RimL family protein N-acetyltransferase